jgi:hypothetical protein
LEFSTLKWTFTEAPILQHFDPAKLIIVQMDASAFAISGILNQYNIIRVLRPVYFKSRNRAPAEYKYGTHHWELLVIVETRKQWRHNLEEANYM